MAEAGANVWTLVPTKADEDALPFCSIIDQVIQQLTKWFQKVALIYNTSKTADQTAAEIAKENNVTARAYQANVANQQDIEAAIDKIVQDFGRLDIVVVNSGVTSNVPAENYTVEQWRKIMDINLDGAFYTAQAAARVFKKQGRGNIIFTASVSANLVNVPQTQAAVSAEHPQNALDSIGR